MKKNISISIVTPSFNQGKFIEKTIQSVVTQEIDNIEHIIIDGGSTDDTLALLKSHSHHLTWISEKDSGQAHAVNKGLKLAHGTIIGWLNSDDIYYEGALKIILDFFESHPACDIVYGQANYIDENDAVIAPYPTQPWNLKNLKRTCFICQPATFFRSRLIQQHGLLHENLHYCMDYEYWLRMAQVGVPFYYLTHSILAGSRLHHSAKSIAQQVESQQESIRMLKQYYRFIPCDWFISCAIAKVRSNRKNYRKNRWYFSKVILCAIRYSLSWNGILGPFLLFWHLSRLALARIISR